MQIKCLIGYHKWFGCKCSACGKTRDEEHHWDKDSIKCVRCGAARSVADREPSGHSRIGKGTRDLSGILADQRKEAVALLKKGASLAVLGRHKEAIECYDRALAIDPRQADAWSNKGVSLAALGRHKEAIECYGSALAINPRYASALLNISASLNAVGLHEQAIEYCDRTLAIDPRQADAWHNKGVSLAALGRRKDLDHDFVNFVAKGNVEAVKGLLAAGANPDMTIKFQGEYQNLPAMKPIHLAAQSGHTQVVQALLSAGADKESRSGDGITALILAAITGRDAVVRTLLAAGVDTEARAPDGSTALHQAALMGHETVVAALLASGADRDSVTPEGITPRGLAEIEGKSAIVALLDAHTAR